VAELWRALNERIPDREFKIGPSYLMNSAVGAPGGLERIWRTEILPLLEEFHYGDGTDVAKQYGLDGLRAAVQQESAEPGNDASTAAASELSAMTGDNESEHG
jgi:5-methylcytosine-specific restriction protein B